MRSQKLALFFCLWGVFSLTGASIYGFNLAIDYRFDETTNGGSGFFDPTIPSGLQARNAMEAAADSVEYWLNDSFAAISPGGSNTWSALFFDPRIPGSNPSTDTESVTDLQIASDSITIFTAAFSGGFGGLLGQAGRGLPVGLSGDSTFQDSVLTRGGAAEFEMWGGNDPV